MKVLPHRIRYYRLRAGLSQPALAEATRLTMQTIHRIETGKSGGTPRTIKAIADAIGVDIERIADLEVETPEWESNQEASG